MTFVLGPTSLLHLEGVQPALVAVVRRAIELTEQDFTVVEGVRSVEQMCINYGKGRTAAECLAKGVPAKYAQPTLAKVTWLNHPLESKHGKKPDGFGHAVDLAPIVNGVIDWNALPRFHAVAEAMLSAAAELNTPIIWGGQWASSPDLPHFELA